MSQQNAQKHREISVAHYVRAMTGFYCVLNITKLFTLVFIFISNFAFAQNRQILPNIQSREFNSISNVQEVLNNGHLLTSASLSKLKTDSDLNQLAFANPSDSLVYDSIYRWTWDTISGYMIYSKTIQIEYDVNNNIINQVYQTWDSNAWQNSYKESFTYDASNNLTTLISEVWESDAWATSYRNTLSYDSRNNRTNYLHQYWINNSWVNSFQHIYTYDANNNLTNSVYQEWDGISWANKYQLISTYDANNNRVSLLQQIWDGSSWLNYTRETFDYDSNNNISADLIQSLDGNTWVNLYQYSYTFNADNKISNYLQQQWDGTTWANYNIYYYTYSASNKLLTSLNQKWNDSTWVNYYQYSNSYDGSDYRTGVSQKSWNDAGTKITNADSTQYYSAYFYAGLHPLKGKDGNITIYPNPGKGIFTVSISNELNAIEIYNASGNLVYSDPKCSNETSRKIDISNSAKGMYFVKIVNGPKSYTKKIVIQ